MNMKSNPPKAPAEQVVKDIRRATRRHYSTEDKIRIVLSGLRGEDSIAELCRKEGIAQGLYYSWSKEFLEACKKRLAGADQNSGIRGCSQRYTGERCLPWPRRYRDVERHRSIASQRIG